MITRTSCPHTHRMVPVDAGTILHIFAYMRTPRPQLYRTEDFPMLFFLCRNCGGLTVHAGYEPISWEQALEWAEGPDDA